MKKAVIFAIILLLLPVAGCNKLTQVKPPEPGVLEKVPDKIKTGDIAGAYIDALDYAIRDFANRDDVIKFLDKQGLEKFEYISYNVDSIEAIPSEKERQDIAKFLSGYGIPFDTRGINSGRTLEEQLAGIEIRTRLNPATDHFEEGAFMVIQVDVFIGDQGRGYVASFKKQGKKLVMTYMFDKIHHAGRP